MTTIIAGRFKQQETVQDALIELERAGFSSDHMSSFYVNPAGQHDTYPIGGDRDKSPGAKESVKGVATGAVVGGAAGMVAAPVLGPVGPLVGAHLGGMVGALSQMKERGETKDDPENTQLQRKSGMLVAVSVESEDHLHHAVDVFRSLGADDIEQSEGTIEHGDWSDFDPIAPVRLIDAFSEHRLQKSHGQGRQ